MSELKKIIHEVFEQEHKRLNKKNTHAYCEKCYCHMCRDSRVIADQIIKAGYVRKQDVRVNESKVASILSPLIELIHNVTHSYMKKKINATECRVKQQEHLLSAAHAITAGNVIDFREGQ